MSKRKQINFIIGDYFQDVQVFRILKEKKLFWLKMHLNIVV